MNMKVEYRENPKTAKSGIVCCIPQTGKCPNGCADCFFQSGRSYLEPLAENLPNMPEPAEVARNGWIVRVNDGNDSNVDRDSVVNSVQCYPLRFYNTSIPNNLGGFDAPVVLTVNPGRMTDLSYHRLLGDMPANLMFVRFSTNMWNLWLAEEAIQYYTSRAVPVVLTFMAYFDTATEQIPETFRGDYVLRKRTLNSYWAITTAAWDSVMFRHRHNKMVYSCGHVEGELGDTKCRFCGNCLREFHAARVRTSGKAV